MIINVQQLPRVSQTAQHKTQEDDVSPDTDGSNAFHTAPVFPTVPKGGGQEDLKLPNLTPDPGSRRPEAVTWRCCF